MPKIRVALDVDGVLCMFHEHCIEIMKESYGLHPHYTTSDVRHWDVTKILENKEHAEELNATIRSKGFAQTMPPYPEAVDAVHRMRALGMEVLFATAPNYYSESWMWDRKLWLKKHFEAPEEDILFVHRKHAVRAHVFVDDKASAVKEWMDESPGGLGFIWDTSYNKGFEGVPRTRSWDEVIVAALSISAAASGPRATAG